ncbi:SAV_2336 N-terminal domain-related protein [Streptomyces wedmorensis]
MKLFAESETELSQEELLDSLWLAGKLPSGYAPLARAAGPAWPDQQHPIPSDEPAPSVDETAPSTESAVEQVGAAPVERQPASPLLADAHLPPDAARQSPSVITPALSVRTPDSHPLSAAQLRLGKALRPLRQRHPDTRRHELDVTGTVAAIADTGVPEIVTRPLRTRWLSLALVVDDGLSMVLWQRLAADVRALMERAGAFRDVRVYGIDTRGEAPSLRTSPYQDRGSRLSPEALCDPTGNTLVLILSDGVGAAWHDGGMRRVTDRWGRSGPTAIVHAMPPRLWASTGISARRWRVTTHRRGGPTHAWHVTDPDLPLELSTFDAERVPVLAPTPKAIATWARLVASPGGTALLPLWNGGESRAVRPVADTRGDDAAEAVVRFREAASAEAYRLAAHVAAVAPVTPPVMRMVQAALGPPTDPGHLTEVFLGGLMREIEADEADSLPHHRRFDFEDETRRVLLSVVSPKELLRTTEAVTQSIEDAVGRASAFPAWVGHPDGAATIDHTGHAFGWLRNQLLARLGIPAALTEPDTPEATREDERTTADPLRTKDPAENAFTDGALGGAWFEDLPDGWGDLTPDDPEWLGRFRIRARSTQGWHHLIMYLAEDEDGTAVTVRAPVPLHDHAPDTAWDLVRREAECLSRMGGTHAPALLGQSSPDPGELPWVAAGCVHWNANDPTSPPAPNLRTVLDECGGAVPTELYLRIGHRFAQAVAHAHAHGLVHGSLSPRCVLVTDQDVSLVGWATATLDGIDSPHRAVLPLSETFLEAHDTGLWLLPEHDVYAVGALLLALHAGRWEDPRAPHTHADPSAGTPPLDPTLLRTLQRCLDDDPARRPSAAVVAEAFAFASGAPASGQGDEFLAGFAEDVRLMRESALDDVGTHGPQFARLLRTYSNHLAAVRQGGRSLDAARESVEVYRQLTALAGDSARPDLSTGLAAALSNLSIRLGEAGRAGESVDAASEAESLYRVLREQDFGSFGSGHAKTLNNLCNRLAATGRHQAALRAIEEAVLIGRRRRDHAEHGADGDLARSLTNLASRLGDLGRWAAARTAVAEAVHIHGSLPDEEARHHWTDHAVSLNNFAVLLGGEGRHSDAADLLDAGFALLDRYGSERPRAASEIHDQSTRIRSWLETLATRAPGP